MIIYVLEIAKKNSILLGKKRNRERQNENWEKNRKWIIGLRFKFAFVHIFHFPVPVIETGARIILHFSPSSVILLVHTTFAQYVDDEYW